MNAKRNILKRAGTALLAVVMGVSMMATAFATEGEPSILSPTLPDAVKDTPYAVELEYTGNITSWSASGLPDGLSIGAGGIISGTPTESGSFSVVVTGSPASGRDVNKSYTLTCADGAQEPRITTNVLDNGNLDEPYRYGMSATGGAITWSATGLPAGLSINNASGMISGVPTADGTFSSVTITVSNPQGQTSRTYSMTIYSSPKITTLTLPEGTEGVAYSAKVEADGAGAVEWTAENLPDGLSINKNTGVISGTPNEHGSFRIGVAATGSAGFDEAVFPLEIKAADEAPAITTASLDGGVMGESYSVTMKATGTAPITWSATGLPNGLRINGNTGEISGTPSAAGTFSVRVKATNDSGNSTVTYDLVITPDNTTYKISGSIDNGGTITGANPQTLRNGESSKEMTFLPASGYRIAKVTVNGIEKNSARGTAKYVFAAIDQIRESYTIVVKTEEIPSSEEGLAIDNRTVNHSEDSTATNAGGTVKVGGKADADKVGFLADQHTVSFSPSAGWEHASTFEVAVTSQSGTVQRFTMKTPSVTNSALKIANGSVGTQNEWDDLFPDAKATVRSGAITLRLADDISGMPYQVKVSVQFVPILTAKSSTSGGSASVSGLTITAEADSRYKVNRIVLVDPETGKSLSITDLPRKENSKGEYYDRDNGDFAGLMTTRIAGETAKVWIEGYIDITKDKSYITEMDVTLDSLPIGLRAEASFSKRNASDNDDADYDEHIFDEDGTGNLTIKNVVKNGSRNKAFTFTLHFPSDADDEYKIDGDVSGYVEDGDSIVLYAGEQATIYGLPEGTRYSIKQDDPGSKYKTAYDVSNGENGTGLNTGSFKIRDGKLTTVVFTNTGDQDTTSTGTTVTPSTDGKKTNPHTGR